MKRVVGIAVLACTPLAANAALQFNTEVSCSGTLAITASEFGPSRVECSGDLSFTGASVISTTPFDIWSASTFP
ncbi:MAG: hypothetical protein Q7T97_02235 [Burkholderiaceae bacterium]|nr:hypothetical protein [Burkholderiaceae bacterium]